MIKNVISAALVAAGVSAASMSVQAGEQFAVLQDIEAGQLQPMTTSDMEAIEGRNHVIRLVLQRTGKDAMPNAASAAATDKAGSIGGVGKDRPAIVKLLD